MFVEFNEEESSLEGAVRFESLMRSSYGAAKDVEVKYVEFSEECREEGAVVSSL